MIVAKVIKVDGDIELCDIEVTESGKWVETSRSESVEDFHRRIKEFMREYLLRRKEK